MGGRPAQGSAWLKTTIDDAIRMVLATGEQHRLDKQRARSGPWSDQTPPTFTGTETVVYAPCKGAKTPSSLTYSVSVTPSAP